MPSFGPLRPDRRHNAGFLTYEAVVTYPFHPLAGQTVLVIGDYEHDGIRHFLIRQPTGGAYQIPDWMFSQGSSFEVVSAPRLPVSSLIEVRNLIDQRVNCPLGRESPGGSDHEETISRAIGPVCEAEPTSRAVCRRASKGSGVVAGPAEGSHDENRARTVGRQRKGGGR